MKVLHFKCPVLKVLVRWTRISWMFFVRFLWVVFKVSEIYIYRGFCAKVDMFFVKKLFQIVQLCQHYQLSKPTVFISSLLLVCFGNLSRLLVWCKWFLKHVPAVVHNRKACRDEAQQQIITSKLSCGISVFTQAASWAVHHHFGVFDVILYPAAFINICVYSDCMCISSSR